MEDVYSWLRSSFSKRRNTDTHTTTNGQDTPKEQEDELKLYGITDKLIDFVKSFSLDTFKNFPLPDEQRGNCGGESPITSGNVQKDLSDWQERHATLVLSKIKEMSQLRFQLCPRHMKERQFWRIYFTLVKSYVAEYELDAIRLAKFKQLTVENENENVSQASAHEVEMSETKKATSVEPPTILEDYVDSL